MRATKKDLLARLEKKVFTALTEALETFRNSVNEAMEINMQRVGQIVQVSASVVDGQNDRVNAAVDLMIEKGLFTEDAFRDQVGIQKARRQKEVELFRVEREARKKLAEEAREKEAAEAAEAAEKEVVGEMALGAVDDAPPDLSNLGSHPAGAEIFGG